MRGKEGGGPKLGGESMENKLKLGGKADKIDQIWEKVEEKLKN